jgi:hypothetical protein
MLPDFPTATIVTVTLAFHAFDHVKGKRATAAHQALQQNIYTHETGAVIKSIF